MIFNDKQLNTFCLIKEGKMNTCDIKTGVCETPGSSGAQTCCAEKCPCGGGCGGDPIRCATKMWEKSFFEALKQAQIEILKAKIQKEMGPKLDKEANAILESMTTKWEALVALSLAKNDLEAKLRELCK